MYVFQVLASHPLPPIAIDRVNHRLKLGSKWGWGGGDGASACRQINLAGKEFKTQSACWEVSLGVMQLNG